MTPNMCNCFIGYKYDILLVKTEIIQQMYHCHAHTTRKRNMETCSEAWKGPPAHVKDACHHTPAGGVAWSRTQEEPRWVRQIPLRLCC